MKKTQFFLSLFLVIILAGSCRKKELRDVTTLEDLGIIHCSNGVIDEDELGLDCGGECEPCVELTAPCTLNDNEIKIFQGFTGVETLTFTDEKTLEIDQFNGSYIFKAYTSGWEYIRITFPGKPDISRTYDDDDITVVHTGNFDRYFHGEMFVNYENGNYVMTCCDADFYNPWNESSYPETQSFKIIFD